MEGNRKRETEFGRWCILFVYQAGCKPLGQVTWEADDNVAFARQCPMTIA
jgi:hypothetical protein